MSSDSSNRSTVPRAIIHERILDAAEAKPEASLDTLAAGIPGATTDLVERVLEEYGDPAEPSTGTDTQTTTSEPTMPEESVNQAPDGLSEGQLEVLYAIYEHPDATQRELAERLDISGPTVSNRVNAIEGFEWDDRQAFAEAVVDTAPSREVATDTNPSVSTDADHTVEANGSGRTVGFDRLTDRVDELERKVDAVAETDATASVFDDPDLVHKIVRACMESDAVTEDEELRILQGLLR